MSKKALYEQVAERLIEEMEKGTSPFQKPWSDRNDFTLPYNPITNKPYRGMNSFWLMLNGENDPRWMTFKQASANGYSIEKGSKGTVINYYKFEKLIDKKDENGKQLFDKEGKKLKQLIKLDSPIISSAYVFNGSQIKGLEPLKVKDENQEWKEDKRIDKLIKNSQVVLEHGGNQAYYSPIADKVTMPKKSQFDAKEKYYSTLLHELGHWTGHESRLDRDMRNKFGSPEYAKEELRAEIASLMLGAELNTQKDFSQHANYIESWISILKEKPFELYQASADAQKIMDYILAFEQKQKIEYSKKEDAKFEVGDHIDYKGNNYVVNKIEPSGKIEIQNTLTGATLRITPEDKLFSNLLEEKNNLQNSSEIKESEKESFSFKR